MRKITLALAFIAGLLTLPAQAANFSAKDAAAATIIFTNPGNCTTGCTPIFAWSDSTGANLVAVLTAGADGASNTANGGLTYARNLVFNGTTWDRWQGAIKAASGAFASGSMVDVGSQADAACGSDNGSCSLIALVKRQNQNSTTLNTSVNTAIPACGTAPCLRTVGNVGIDPSSGVATPTFAFLALPATTTTQIVALSGSTKTYVTSLMAFGGGTVNVTFKYGTGSNCGTGTTTLAGPYPLTAQAGFSLGAGVGPVMIVPSGQALCITTDASVSGGVQLTFQQI